MSIILVTFMNSKNIADFANQIIHGDCRQVMQDLPSQSVDLIVTDPPYLVNYRPRDGRSVANDDSASWVGPAFAEMYRVLKPDSFCVSFYGWPQVDQFMRAWKEAGFRPVSHFVWVKHYSSREGYTSSYHETGYLLAKGYPPKPRTPPEDVLNWAYTDNRLHPTQKPLLAIRPLVNAYSRPGEIVLDPFCGSGTTAVVAKQLGRKYVAIEISQQYASVAQRRCGLVNR